MRNLSPQWEDVITTFPRGELRDYLGLVAEEEVRIAVKPQYIDKLPKIFQGKVLDLLERVDERNEVPHFSMIMGIDHILERNLDALSGGELQRVAICATLRKKPTCTFSMSPLLTWIFMKE